MSIRFDRRRLLRGLGGGVALLAPFARHRVAEAAPAGNFLCWASPNGFVRTDFGAVAPGAPYELKPSTAKLTPYKDDLVVIRGLSNKSSSRGSSHEEMCRMLACWHGDGSVGTPPGPSFDYVLGLALGKPTLVMAVTAAGGPSAYSGLSWSGPRTAISQLGTPISAYKAAFGSALPDAGAGNAAVELVIKRRKSVLDFVVDDVGRFRRRLNGTDATNLDLYLDALRQAERAMADRPVAAGACNPEPLRALAEAAKAGRDPTLFRNAAQLMFDVALASFACGTRRVATISGYAATLFNPVQPGASDHHAVSHGAMPVDVWKAIDAWHAELFATLLQKMRATGLMDSTIAVWGSDISQGHNQCDCVYLVAGGRALGIKVGQAIVYPFYGTANASQNAALQASRDPRNRSVHDLWVSVQKALGIRSDTFGDKEYCTGGLKELYAG